jgi:hypothetical protein
MKVRAALGALPALLALACGCAATSVPSRELVAARTEVARARWSPLAERALPELVEAEAALEEAEAEARVHPGSAAAEDVAYVARRKAERARIAGLYAADLEALHRARASVAQRRAMVLRRRRAP